jgi:lipid-A-disaccharide synthase
MAGAMPASSNRSGILGPRIAMVAGEASGDLLAAHLISALRQCMPGASFMGIGGPRMQAEGFDAWWPAEKLAVRGYVEVLRHYREITGIRARLAQRLEHERPDLFIGVDAPDFNLDLETRLRAGGMRTCHYVSPSIWAWRGGRIEKIRRAADHVMCLFPFEEALYADAGIAATYVGHPMADLIRAEASDAAARCAARKALDLPADRPVIALLPGSRQSELHALARRFVDVARRIATARPSVHFVVPLASPETEAIWLAAQAGEAGTSLPITLASRASHQALAACDTALVASGTATLEAALFRRPMVIAYNMSPLSWFLMKRMKYQPYVGLPNILCGQFVVPEFLQDDATPANLAQALCNLLDDRPLCERIASRFAQLHEQLRQDNAMRAADAVAALLQA